MRQLAISLFLVLKSILIVGQSDVKLVQIKENSFIEISQETLIKFLNQTMDEWVDLMKENGYTEMDNSDGIVIYSKGEIGKQIQAIAKNRLGLITVDWIDSVDKIRMTKEIEKKVENLFFTKMENISYYIYYEYIIGLELTQENDYTFERIYIKRK